MDYFWPEAVRTHALDNKMKMAFCLVPELKITKMSEWQEIPRLPYMLFHPFVFLMGLFDSRNLEYPDSVIRQDIKKDRVTAAYVKPAVTIFQ